VGEALTFATGEALGLANGEAVVFGEPVTTGDEPGEAVTVGDAVVMTAGVETGDAVTVGETAGFVFVEVSVVLQAAPSSPNPNTAAPMAANVVFFIFFNSPDNI
jgi:hypothetical protein